MSNILEITSNTTNIWEMAFPTWWVNLINHLIEKHGGEDHWGQVATDVIVKSELSLLNIKIDDDFKNLEFETEQDKMFFILKWS